MLKPLDQHTLADIAASIGGDISPPDAAARAFGGVATDSRQPRPGDFFLALRGEKFDGHRFLDAAARAGAAGLIIEQNAEIPASLANLPILRVADTLRAYGDLAAARRAQWDGPVLALSGSAGKTTTRRLAAAALARHCRALEPIRNYNNLVGVPHTLLRLEPEHEVAVLELGMNQPGELRRLAEVARPDAALLTQIGMTHIGMFNSIDELISAKFDLFRACSEAVPLVINAACPRTFIGFREFCERPNIFRFTGEKDPLNDQTVTIRIRNAAPMPPIGYRFDLVLPDRALAGLELRIFGRHHLENVAAAAALLLAGGFDPAWIADALPDFHSEPLRGDVLRAGELTLVLDCYNASPAAMHGALASLAEVPHNGRRVIVLADMLELGPQTEIAHESLLPALRRLGPALFFGLGRNCAQLADDLADAGWTAHGYDSDRDALTAELRRALRPGDVVFFKGSHGFGLEQVARAIAPEAGIANH